ncbi:HAMP domain-containing sensor histidine kinase [Salinispora pacifica]|uniref:HAMP domain-containing sensor histidine kinase n=1 Tax=Salinispora pacifica TaxID=351187 RepID=UPI00036D7793|nr:HAMP domain-containing sensor histidine kinase [Salinispora pacifica]
MAGVCTLTALAFLVLSANGLGDRSPWWLPIGVGVALVATAVLVVDRVATRTVRAARDLTQGALALGAGDLNVRVQPSGPGELVAAGYAFNRMAEHLVATRADERELVADLSHRLRTPLTALRLDAEALDPDDTSIGLLSEAELDRRRGIRRIRQAIATLEDEVDQLIKTTRKAATQETAPGSCDVSEVVRERMRFWSALAGDQNRPFRVTGAQLRIPVPVPRAELAAALDAVIGNVFRYTPQGTAFEVAVSRRDGYVAIRIDDAGLGVADPDRALRRGASDRGSTGLGLDIVKRVAVQANGSVSIDRAQLGGASVVMLLADPEATPRHVSRFGLVGRRAREARDHADSGRRRWSRRRPADR